MFDNLRESEDDRRAFQEAIGLTEIPAVEPTPDRRRAPRGSFRMTAAQRLVIALLTLLAVVVLGTMCLLVTGRISAF